MASLVVKAYKPYAMKDSKNERVEVTFKNCVYVDLSGF